MLGRYLIKIIYSLVFLLFFYLSHLYWIDLVVSANFTISDYLALEAKCSSVGDSQKRKDEVISSELQLDLSSNDRICCVVIDNYTQEVDMGLYLHAERRRLLDRDERMAGKWRAYYFNHSGAVPIYETLQRRTLSRAI